MHAVGADTGEPPGPGPAVTIIDSGLDMTHPEFATRPDTTSLNTQTTADDEWPRHRGRLGRRRARERPRARRRLPAGRAAHLGREPRRRAHDRRRDRGITPRPRRRAGRDQPQPRLQPVSTRSSSRPSHARSAAARSSSPPRGTPATRIPQEYPASLPARAHGRRDDPSRARSPPSRARREAIDLAAPGVDIPVAVPRPSIPPATAPAARARASRRRSSPAPPPGSATMRPDARRRRSSSSSCAARRDDIAPAGRDSAPASAS